MRRTVEAMPLLLQLGERVIAVAQDLSILDTWHRRAYAKNGEFSEASDDEHISDSFFVKYCSSKVKDVFISGAPEEVQCGFFNGYGLINFLVSIIWDSPAKVLLVVRRIATAEALQLENKWKLALDAAGDGVWDIDLERKTISFSDKWHEMFGYEAADIPTLQDWGAKIHPDDMKLAEQSIANYYAGKTDVYSAEVRYQCKNGDYKWILSRGVVISWSADGKPQRFIGTHKDIDARRKEEDELRTTRDMFANSFAYSGTGKALVAPGGKWLAVNDVICQWTGYTKDELEGLHYRDITYHEDVDLDIPYIPRLLSKELPAYTIEKRYVSKARKIIYTLLTVSVVWDKPGVPKFFICDIVNITTLKEMMSKITRSSSDMGTASSNLENRIKQLEELNYIIAHNLRGPVGNIGFLADNRELFGDSAALDMIKESSEGLSSELEQLLHMSTIKMDKGITNDNCVVADIVNDILVQLQGSLFEKNIEVISQFGVAEILYPKVYLESIFYNLISNAVKYADMAKKPFVSITTKQENGKTILTVKDNGIGIDMRAHGGDVFKLNKVFHKGYDSKGVGLFITKTQVEAMGGMITVHSKPGEGTEFTVIF